MALENFNNAFFSLLPGLLGFSLAFISLSIMIRLISRLLLGEDSILLNSSNSFKKSSKVELSKTNKKMRRKGNRASHSIREVGERKTTSNDDDSLLPLITTLAVTSAILSSDDDNSNNSSYDSSSDYDSSS
ncbi:hypothetical protein AB1I88_28415, partial [Bacillus paranthracis]